MTNQLRISVRRVAPLSDHEDANVAGIYVVVFASEVRELPLPKLASIALDIFHSSVSVGVLDDFDFTVVHGADTIIEQDPDHDEYSGSEDGHVYKTSNQPMYLASRDACKTGDDLDAYYNPDGDGEHPVFSRAMWIDAVQARLTLRGYWDFAASLVEEASARMALS